MLSVIMPVCNGFRFIREAIASIERSDDMPIEIIVVDDASTDETREILGEIEQARTELRIERLPSNVGPGPARNHGLKLARGDMIAFLDADDRYAPGALKYLRGRLIRHDEIDVVMGTVRALKRQATQDCDQSFKPSGDRVRVFQLGSILARRRVFDRFGDFNPTYRHGEDIDWFFRLQEGQARFDLVDQLVLHHRRHAENMSDAEPEGVFDIAMVIGASLARRKKMAVERGIAIEEIYYIRPDRIRMEEGT